MMTIAAAASDQVRALDAAFWTVALLCAALLFAISLPLPYLAELQAANLEMLVRLSQVVRPAPAASDLVMVTIDAAAERAQRSRWPFPREVLARAQSVPGPMLWRIHGQESEEHRATANDRQRREKLLPDSAKPASDDPPDSKRRNEEKLHRSGLAFAMKARDCAEGEPEQ